MKVLFRATRVNPFVVQPANSIEFDYVISIDPALIAYNPATGVITFLQKGFFRVDWSVAVQASPATNGSSYTLVSSEGHSFVSNSPIKNGPVNGMAYFEVVNPPMTISLQNTSNNDQYQSVILTENASITIYQYKYLSSFIEIGSNVTQTIANDGYVSFEVVENEGTAFTVPDQNTVQINEPGLFSITWVLNLAPSTIPPVVFCIEETNPNQTFNLSHVVNSAAGGGNFTGICLTDTYVNLLPVTLRLKNRSGIPVEIISVGGVTNGFSATMIISKFADGPS